MIDLNKNIENSNNIKGEINMQNTNRTEENNLTSSFDDVKYNYDNDTDYIIEDDFINDEDLSDTDFEIDEEITDDVFQRDYEKYLANEKCEIEDNTDESIDVKTKVIPEQKQQIPTKSNPPKSRKAMLYSTKAKNDGYDFSHLPDIVQELSRYYYISENAMSNFYLIQQTSYILDYTDEKPYLNYQWGFPKSGLYYGYIVSCYGIEHPFDTKCILNLLVNDSDVVRLKFSKNFNDPIFSEFIGRLNYSDNIFHPTDMSDIYGYNVVIEIENIVTKIGKNFSKVKSLRLISTEEIKAINQMIDVMFEQSSNKL